MITAEDAAAWAKKYGLTFPREEPGKAEAEGGQADGQALPAPEEKRNPTRKENEFMLNLMILIHTMAVQGEECRDRAHQAGKWTWRNIRLMLALAQKVQADMLSTMPEKRKAYYYEYATRGHYELVMNGPHRATRFVLISDRHLAALTEAAICSDCVMCILQGSEIGQCKLRQALLEVAPPKELQDGRWAKCEYREYASKLIRGEEITV